MDQSQNTSPNQPGQFTNLKAVLTTYFYHWPLFILGLFMAAVVAITYLQLTKPVYEISATILVKDEKKSPQEKSNLQEIELSNSPKNAETEVQVLTSKKLIAQVVNDLDLANQYSIGDLSRQELYQNTPVKFSTENADVSKKQELSVFIVDERTATVSGADFSNKPVKFNEFVETGLGKWKLIPTANLNQYIGKRINITVSNPASIIKAYTKALDVRLLDKSAPTIGLFLTDVVPQRGKQFLNALITAYNTAAAREERQLTKNTIEFIDKRLSTLTGELGDAESKVEGYRSSQGITDINSQSKVYLENVQANDTKLNEVNVKLNNINNIEKYVNGASNKNIAPATLGISDDVLNGLIENLTALQLKRVALLTTTPEGNPMFEPINMQIKTTKAAIRENIAGAKASLLGEKSELQSINSKVQSSIKEIPGQERQYVGMKRQESIKENLYVYLLQKREELALSYASTQAEARIVDNANVGDVKWPRPSLVWAIALLLGLGVPFMIIYFRHAFNQKITEKLEIENEVDIPVLGEVSYEDLDKVVILPGEYPQIIGEQFRAIRTKIYHLSKEDPTAKDSASMAKGKITLCTSSTVNEGKSFVASNLAASMAAAGRKTILLEMDLRRPSIAAIFKLDSNLPGVGEFLNASATLKHIIHPSGIQKDLFIIPSGKVVGNPSELLEGKEITKLLDQLRTQFEEIVIDSPPVHLVTDARIIGRHADLCLYIVRQGHTRKQELSFIKQLSSEVPNMNIIFNGITSGKYSYGYDYDKSYYLKREENRDFKISWKTLVGKL